MAEVPLRPDPNDRTSWPGYWRAQGQSWRIEPEISAERQSFLANQRAASIAESAHPFGGIRLDRSDVEWLISLPREGRTSTEGQETAAGLDLSGADLRGVVLDGLTLDYADFSSAYLDDASLNNASARDVNFAGCSMQGLRADGADMAQANLTGALMRFAHFERALLRKSILTGAVAESAHFERADLAAASLAGLGGNACHFEATNLWTCDLTLADLSGAHFEAADLSAARLRRADLRGAYLDQALLANVDIAGALVADVRWGQVNVAGIDWPRVRMLGDEHRARQRRTPDGLQKDRATRIAEYSAAVRAYRGLLPLLRERYLRTHADRFSYRSLILERRLSLLERRWFEWYWSLIFDFIAGYGYRPARMFFAYFVLATVFASWYYVLSHVHDIALPRNMTWPRSYTYSLQVVLNGSLPGSSGVDLSDAAITVFDIQRLVTIVYGFLLSNIMSKRLFGSGN